MNVGKHKGMTKRMKVARKRGDTEVRKKERKVERKKGR